VMINKYDELIKVIEGKAITYGDFELSSGKYANKYIDLRKVSLNSYGSVLIASLIWDKIYGLEVDAVGGPTIGADPIVGAVIALAFIRDLNNDLEGFIVRKSRKPHGLGNLIEGNIKNGDKVVLIDDVVTSGGSLLDAAKSVESIGAEVVKIVSVIDRGEGGSSNILDAGYFYDPLLRIYGSGYGSIKY
jgi:orotate phosphoribosyltransferase